jgi:hypothetical protein
MSGPTRLIQLSNDHPATEGRIKGMVATAAPQ